MMRDPRRQVASRIGLALLGLLTAEFGVVAEFVAGRAFSASLLVHVAADVLAAAFVAFALYCFGCAIRGHVPQWYSEGVS